MTAWSPVRNWMIAGVGAGQGAGQADTAAQPACDIIWCNTAPTGNVAMWSATHEPLAEQ